MRLQGFDGIQFSSQLFVGEQRVNHSVAVVADVDCDSPAATFRSQVMCRDSVHSALAQRTIVEYFFASSQALLLLLTVSLIE